MNTLHTKVTLAALHTLAAFLTNYSMSQVSMSDYQYFNLSFKIQDSRYMYSFLSGDRFVDPPC